MTPNARIQGSLWSANLKDDKDDQPNSRDPQAKDQQALQQSFEQSHPITSGVAIPGLPEAIWFMGLVDLPWVTSDHERLGEYRPTGLNHRENVGGADAEQQHAVGRFQRTHH